MTDIHPETGLPVEQCPGRGDHATHNWNIYDPTGVKLTRVNPDGARTCTGFNPFAGIDWEGRIGAQVTAHAARRLARQTERASMNERRRHGLSARHRNKLARNRGPAGTTHERNTAMTKDELAQEMAEYIATELQPRLNDTDAPIVYAGAGRPPTEVADIKATILAGHWWVSWMDDRTAAGMRQIHGTPAL